MSVQAISKQRFDELCPPERRAMSAYVEDKGWLAHSSQELLGVFSYDVVDRDWCFVVFGKDPAGAFRRVDGDPCVGAGSEAEIRLSLMMDEIATANGF